MIRLTPASRAHAPEVLRTDTVGLLEGLRRSHRVDEIVRRVNPEECGTERRRVEDVARHDFDRCALAVSEARGLARQAAYPATALLEHRKQTSTDVAGGAREKNSPGSECARHDPAPTHLVSVGLSTRNRFEPMAIARPALSGSDRLSTVLPRFRRDVVLASGR